MIVILGFIQTLKSMTSRVILSKKQRYQHYNIYCLKQIESVDYLWLINININYALGENANIFMSHSV